MDQSKQCYVQEPYQNRTILSEPLEMRTCNAGIKSSALTKSEWASVDEMSFLVYSWIGQNDRDGVQKDAIKFHLHVPEFDSLGRLSNGSKE